uniref:Uncharacterized protein n=1 Tax=Oryza meridionalis TaxID=40149 RepID=A0A0E0E8B8_9ORYZ
MRLAAIRFLCKGTITGWRNYHGLEDKSPGCSNFLALVPWTPPQIATASNWSSPDSEKREFFEVPMESDETEVDSMDVEESPEANAAAINGESLHQWAVATPSSLPNPSAPVMCSRKDEEILQLVSYD